MFVYIQCAYTCELLGQYLEVPGVKVEEGVVAVPAQCPAHQQQLQDWPDILQRASM